MQKELTILHCSRLTFTSWLDMCALESVDPSGSLGHFFALPTSVELTGTISIAERGNWEERNVRAKMPYLWFPFLLFPLLTHHTALFLLSYGDWFANKSCSSQYFWLVANICSILFTADCSAASFVVLRCPQDTCDTKRGIGEVAEQRW